MHAALLRNAKQARDADPAPVLGHKASDICEEDPRVEIGNHGPPSKTQANWSGAAQGGRPVISTNATFHQPPPLLDLSGESQEEPP